MVRGIGRATEIPGGSFVRWARERAAGTIVVMSVKRMRFAAILVVAAGLMAFLMFTAFGGQLRAFVGPGELKADGRAVQLNARVTGAIPASPAAAAHSEAGLRFTVVDKTTGASPVTVVYRGIVPDTFCSGREIKLDGVLRPDGTFLGERDTLQAICPTKFRERKGRDPNCGLVEPAGSQS